jgi:ankyrin repeat protein
VAFTDDGAGILTKLVLSAVIALALTAMPVFAAGECDVLCDPEFYETATTQSVREVIEAGADVNGADDAGKSPLHWVAKATPETIAALLEAGAEVNARDYLDRMPFHFISAASTPENVTLLLGAGADVNGKTANDWTPLHGVAKFGIPENIIILLDAGADASARTEMGETALEFAAGNDRIKDSDAYEVLQTAQDE